MNEELHCVIQVDRIVVATCLDMLMIYQEPLGLMVILDSKGFKMACYGARVNRLHNAVTSC